ncbi:MAG TPA: class I SAM-dependent methyltransferase [Noviherbaspirillum sp.]|uniref:class I SAM-dependent methyltransferase n=1 Tax=Noviherbaspirillum sp. TaxID=1926288 RepID=UPI002B463465|nr:class I SAM-dependent methyltransferase [Noviherbaspirillum sp.]HJV88171.1 class I SAM-dependent methyltransferase [Noviherbaspirillum sp.]
MQHSAIASAYDTLAPIWQDGHFNESDGINQHKRALGFLGPHSTPGAALNVGCGCSTRFNALLRDCGLEIEGVDISDRMVTLAREADPAVQVHRADICTWQPHRTYRFITAWDSIWHVQLAEQRALMLKLMGLLEPGGVLLFSAGGLDRPSEHTDSAMGPTVYYSTLGIPGLLQVIQEAGCALRHLEFDQWPQSHLAVIAQRGA